MPTENQTPSPQRKIWETEGVELICLCYVANATPAQIHYALRRIRRRLPKVSILVALLGNSEPFEDEEVAGTAEIVQQSLPETVEKITAVISKQAEAATTVEKPAAA
jgi:hypothetical protein